jgi:hypothetical protein
MELSGCPDPRPSLRGLGHECGIRAEHFKAGKLRSEGGLLDQLAVEQELVSLSVAQQPAYSSDVGKLELQTCKGIRGCRSFVSAIPGYPGAIEWSSPGATILVRAGED